MSEKDLTEVYERLLDLQMNLNKVSEILSQVSDMAAAQTRLAERQQWQIVDLNKRVKVLEAMSKEQPGT